MIKKSTIKKVGMLEDFAFWIAEEILDEELWELNASGNAELIARKLTKCGILKCVDGYYHLDEMYHRAEIELIAEKRRMEHKTVADMGGEK